MPRNSSFRGKFVLPQIATFLLCVLLAAVPLQAQKASDSATAASSGLLTVDRIYGQPSLSGRLTRAVAWTPDNKKLSYFETAGSGKSEHTSLWAIDLSSSERTMLIAADKLETVLPAKHEETSQATGLGRHAPSEYRWAPNGEALLLLSLIHI